MAEAALWREESRGGHYRKDFSHRDDVQWNVHSTQKIGNSCLGIVKIS